MKTRETIVTVDGVDLNIKYVISGKYMPSTRLDPEEYAEIEIYSICVSDSEIDIQELLSKKQMEEVTDAIYE